MSKRTISMILAFAMILGSFSLVSAGSDIDGHWAREKIQYLLDEDIVEGYPDGEFKPNRAVTRAEFSRIINGALEFTEHGDVSFRDVSVGDWYYEDVVIAVGAGYLDGYTDNTVKPNNNITREEAATMIGRALAIEQLDEQSAEFTDIDEVQDYAK